jgi:hypothetical protein
MATLCDMLMLLVAGTYANTFCAHIRILMMLQPLNRGARVITTDRRLKGPDFSLIKQV